jgi:hypothetical protein
MAAYRELTIKNHIWRSAASLNSYICRLQVLIHRNDYTCESIPVKYSLDILGVHLVFSAANARLHEVGGASAIKALLLVKTYIKTLPMLHAGRRNVGAEDASERLFYLSAAMAMLIAVVEFTPAVYTYVSSSVEIMEMVVFFTLLLSSVIV